MKYMRYHTVIISPMLNPMALHWVHVRRVSERFNWVKNVIKLFLMLNTGLDLNCEMIQLQDTLKITSLAHLGSPSAQMAVALLFWSYYHRIWHYEAQKDAF